MIGVKHVNARSATAEEIAKGISGNPRSDRGQAPSIKILLLSVLPVAILR